MDLPPPPPLLQNNYKVNNPCLVLINNFIEDEATMKRENREDNADAAEMRSFMMKLKDFFQHELGFKGLEHYTLYLSNLSCLSHLSRLSCLFCLSSSSRLSCLYLTCQTLIHNNYKVNNPCLVLINNFIEDEDTMKRENRKDDADAAEMRSFMMKLKDFFMHELGFKGLQSLDLLCTLYSSCSSEM
jgi:hypothetical protein